MVDCEHSSTATRRTRLCARLRKSRLSRRARAGSCSATPMAARCRTRSSASSARSRANSRRRVGIHAHNDTEQRGRQSLPRCAPAPANPGTLNGLGERCGNANLVFDHPDAEAQDGNAEQFEIGVSPKRSARSRVSHTLDELLNRAPNRHAPYVGESAFATKAGIHASAIVKEPATYEHVAPESVGNKRKLLVSDQAGTSNMLAELDAHRHRGRQERSAPDAAARRGQGARGDGLCL